MMPTDAEPRRRKPSRKNEKSSPETFTSENTDRLRKIDYLRREDAMFPPPTESSAAIGQFDSPKNQRPAVRATANKRKILTFSEKFAITASTCFSKKPF